MLELSSPLLGFACPVPVEDVVLEGAQKKASQAASGSVELRENCACVGGSHEFLRHVFRILIAQTTFSKRILLAMPVGMFCLMNVLNPEYVRPLYTTSMGNMQLMLASFLLLLGWWVMNRLAAIR